MMKLTRSGLIALVFLAGCAVGGASSRLVEPVQAQAPRGPRWQYRCIDVGASGDAEDVEREGNHLGAFGFEMAGVTGKFWCFKRQW